MSKTKFNPKFDLRNHAIEQYLSRTRTNISALQTRIFLNRQIEKGVYKLTLKTRSGEDRWHVPSANCILICKYESGINVVVTIIKDDRIEDNVVSLVQSCHGENDLFSKNLLKFDTFTFGNDNNQNDISSSLEEKLINLVQNNKTEVVEKISSRTKVHKTRVENQTIYFKFNTNSKTIEILKTEKL